MIGEEMKERKEMKEREKRKKIIELMIYGLIMNSILILSIQFDTSSSEIGTMSLVIQYLSSVVIIGLTLQVLRVIYFNDEIRYKEKLLLVFVFIITMLNALITLFAQIAYTEGLCSGGKFVMPSIIDSYYFSIVTFTTLGYGDFTPTKDLRLLFAGEALIGYIFFASIMGMLIALIIKDNKSNAIRA